MSGRVERLEAAVCSGDWVLVRSALEAEDLDLDDFDEHGEEFLKGLALLLKVAARKGWPDSPGGALRWALRERNRGGAAALSDLRKRHAAQDRTTLAALGLAGLERDHFAMLDEPLPPDFNAQMNALDRMQNKT